jgi:hypothetical protein
VVLPTTNTACKTEHSITTNALRPAQGSKLIPQNNYNTGVNLHYGVRCAATTFDLLDLVLQYAILVDQSSKQHSVSEELKRQKAKLR